MFIALITIITKPYILSGHVMTWPKAPPTLGFNGHMRKNYYLLNKYV